MRGLGRIKKEFRKVQSYFAPAAVILMYHRIMDEPVNPYGIVVSPDHFYQHLECIWQSCQVVSLPDLIQAVRRGSVPRRAVAITFDDGYVDFFDRAYPALVSAGLPATVFVTSGHVDCPISFWSDSLTRILLLTGSLPPHLRLKVRSVEHQWTVISPEERQLAHQAVYDLLMPLRASEQADIVTELCHWAGIEQPWWPEDRAMTSSELIAVAQEGLIIVGAHTISHPQLSALPPDAQYAEILGSRQQLQALTGQPVSAFAYPFGTAEDFTDETVGLVEQSGFGAACTVTGGVVDAKSKLLQLRRNWVGDWDIRTFRKNLEWFFLQ